MDKLFAVCAVFLALPAAAQTVGAPALPVGLMEIETAGGAEYWDQQGPRGRDNQSGAITFSREIQRIQQLRNANRRTQAAVAETGRAASGDEITMLIEQAGRYFRDALSKGAYRPEDYVTADEWVVRLLAADPTNGHGLYFRCEILRKTAKVRGAPWNESHDFCGKYLEVEPTVADAQGDDRNTVKGYFRERTAWISHMMANDFYEEGMKTGERAFFETARSLAAHALSRHPVGFDGRGKKVATQELIVRLDALLAGR